MQPDDDLWPISRMCAEYGVTARTLRFYEAKELLFPLRRGQARLFARSDRARLTLILRGKRFGFSLEDIRQLLALYHLGDAQMTQLRRTLVKGHERLAAMRAQRDELGLLIDDLALRLDWLAQTLDQRETTSPDDTQKVMA